MNLLGVVEEIRKDLPIKADRFIHFGAGPVQPATALMKTFLRRQQLASRQQMSRCPTRGR